MQAGASSRAIKSLLVLPLDTIRVRAQTAPPPAPGALSSGPLPLEPSQEAGPTVPGASGTWGTDARREAGAGGGEKWSGPAVWEAVSDLYRGWLPALAVAGPSTAVFFGVNEYMLAILPVPDAGWAEGGGGWVGTGGSRAVVAAAAASVASWLIRTPFEVVKVALMGEQFVSSVAAVQTLGFRGRERESGGARARESERARERERERARARARESARQSKREGRV